jgi:hypothetical protein
MAVADDVYCGQVEGKQQIQYYQMISAAETHVQ